jgi:hypothetical protein
MLAIAVFAALIMGGILGLLGGGGSILAVPILVYLVGLETKAAIAGSLLVVGTTSIVAAISHARNGNVVWRTGLVFGAFAMCGAFIGGSLARFVPGNVLLLLFAGLMLVTAVAMLRKHPECTNEQDVEPAEPKKLSIPKIAVEGLVVGAVTGLVGAGGGFLVVPALVFLGGLPMRKAIGTSLMVIAMKSFAGFAGYVGFVELNYSLIGAFVITAIAGTLLGTWASKFVEAGKLRQTFAWFVLIMGMLIVAQKAGLMGQPLPDSHGAEHEEAVAEQSIVPVPAHASAPD